MCSSLSPVYLPVNIFDYLLPVIYVQHYVASFHLPINIFLLTFSICKTSTFSCAFAQYVSKKEDQKELKLYRTVNTPPPLPPPTTTSSSPLIIILSQVWLPVGPDLRKTYQLNPYIPPLLHWTNLTLVS